MVTQEKVREWIDMGYSNAVYHGFHDDMLSIPHMLMLVLTEVSEMIQADRRGRYADLSTYDGICASEGCVFDDEMFKIYIKDSVEDEMADICIRLFDFCGALNIEPVSKYELFESLSKDFSIMYKDFDMCERCFVLSCLLCRCENASTIDDGTPYSIPFIVGACLAFVFAMAGNLGIDLSRFIELKMSYNQSRLPKHGVAY